MTQVRVDAPSFRDLILAAAKALEDPFAISLGVAIHPETLADMHAIVALWNPEEAIRMHFTDTHREVIDD